MAEQARLPEMDGQPAGADDEATRAGYREQLREHLKDPAFRAIEGFPIGDDEAILALSDPPYYTACPNPFLPEIIAGWQAERARLRAELGLPDDSADNGNGNDSVYHREPFAADVSEGKNDPIYSAHSYHTKVPHKAIMRYILHYTDPGDIVFDGFCGSGMTGVAAQLCGDRTAVEGLGYRVRAGIVYDGDQAVSRVGVRKSVLVDLSPAATFIARNYNAPVDIGSFQREARRILSATEQDCSWLYETWYPHCDDQARVKAKINYVVWSDVFACPQCGHELVFWDAAVDEESLEFHEVLTCPHCHAVHNKRDLDRVQEIVYDDGLKRTLRRAKQVPALINCSVAGRRHEKHPDSADLILIQRIGENKIPHWFPVNRMPAGDESRRNDDIGMTYVHHFYTKRNLWAFAALWSSATTAADRCALMGGYRVGLKLSTFLVPQWFNKSTGPMKPLTAGTLYAPSLSGEQNWFNIFRSRCRSIARQLAGMRASTSGTDVTISTSSATRLQALSDDFVDYIFVDPPFGANLMYSELSFINEAWLQVMTNSAQEAVINATQGKGLLEYQALVERCFREFRRVLKPGRWMTIEFHNSQNRVWNAIQTALQSAGFVVADVRTLDKQQGSFKQYASTGTVKQDLIISGYKPSTAFERRFQKEAGTAQGAWDFVRQHLAYVPVVAQQDGTLEVVAERQAYLLYDRMVAFHIQRGATVPLSAAEFYAGLKERFAEKDGMYFLHSQLGEYERARLEAGQVMQLTLFLSDEKTAIQWLRQQLDPALGGHPQTYQEIQPAFLQQLHQARHEDLPELSEMLEHSFLKDNSDRWHVPDPNKAADLEALRQKDLLRQFAEYAAGSGRLRQFRTEAVRAGFADALKRHDYEVIVKVAERMPDAVLQEDAELLMYYDSATLRVK